MNDKRLDEVEWTGTSDKTIERIMNEGITTINQLLTYTPKELSEKIHSRIDTVDKVIYQALKQYGLGFKSGTTVGKEQSERLRISTGSKALNNLLNGGVESNAITEFIGEFKGGKTQQVYTLGVIAANHPADDEHGKSYVVFIDCENTFMGNRVSQIASERGYNAKDTLTRFLVATPFNSIHQGLLINQLDLVLKDYYVNLIIVDGMLSHLRSEYIGRENMPERQGLLANMLSKLLSLADSHDIPVVVTNQVQGNVTGFGEQFSPAGGHVMAHACTHRIMLRKGRANTRIIQVIDSPSINDEERVRIAITSAGIVDEDGSFPNAEHDVDEP